MPVYGVSFQGKRHIQKGMPCQDHYGCTTTPNGWIVAVVADGVSASPNSEIGAAIAVDSCLEYFSGLKYSPFFDADGIQLVIRDAFNYALRCIKESNRPGEFIPFSKMTTLQVLIFHNKIGLHWGQAGDGALIIRNAKGRWKRVTFPMKNKEDNESPITLQDGPDAWKFGSLSAQGIDSILLATDGVADVIADENTDEEVSDAVVSFLMTPPNTDLNKQQTDSYYQSLFFGTDDKSRLCDDEVTNTAITRLSSITDDITVLLVNGLCSPESNNIREPESNGVAQSVKNPETESRERHDSVDNKYQRLSVSSGRTSQDQSGQSQYYGRKIETPSASNGQTGYEPVIDRNPNHNTDSEFQRTSSLFDTVLNKVFGNKSRLLTILLIIILLALVANRLSEKTSKENNAKQRETTVESEIITSPMETTTHSSDDQALVNDKPDPASFSETTDTARETGNPEQTTDPKGNEIKTKSEDREAQILMDSVVSPPDADMNMEPGDNEQQSVEGKSLDDNDEGSSHQ